MTNVEIRVSEDVSGCRLIAGFHGIGLTGYIATKHIVVETRARRIGFVETETTNPVITTTESGILLPIALYRHEDFVILLAESPIEPDRVSRFSRALVEWAKNSGLKEALLIGGLDKSLQRDPRVLAKIVVTNNERSKELAEFLGLPLLEPGLNVVGPLASILAYCELLSLPAVAILPYANDRPDPLAAAVAIDIINEKFGLGVDTTKLRRDAERIEREMEKMIKLSEEGFRREEYHGMYI